MRSEIIDLIYEISTNEAGIYSGLFGFDGMDIEKTINYNWTFKKENDLYDNIKIFLDHLIYTLVNEFNLLYELEVDDPIYNSIWYNGVEYINNFIDKSVDLQNINCFCDLENLLNDLQITSIGSYINLSLILPIYKMNI